MKLRQLVAQEVPPGAHCTVVLTHSPQDQPLRDLLPFLAVDRPAAFAAFQSTHRATSAGRTLRKASHVACPTTGRCRSFRISRSPREARDTAGICLSASTRKSRFPLGQARRSFADPWIAALQVGFAARGLAKEQQDAAGKETEIYRFSRTGWMRPMIGQLVVFAAPSPTCARLLKDFDREALDVPTACEHYLEVLGGRDAVERRVASILTGLRG